MNFREVLYVIRAACRSWDLLTGDDFVPTTVVVDLAADINTLLEGEVEALRDARAVMLGQRPFSRLDFHVFAVTEAGLLCTSSQNEAAEMAAFDAAMLAVTTDDVVSNYRVDILSLYDSTTLMQAVGYLQSRGILRSRPEAFEKAFNLILLARDRPPVKPLPSDHRQ